MMLIAAAAQTWGVPEETCQAERNEVIHRPSGRRATYGALAAKAATLPVPKDVTLKTKDFRLLGQPLLRVDLAAKVNGTAVFGIDAKVPGLLTARVARCPVFGGKVSSFDAAKAKAIPGVRHVVQIESGVAVVADGFWQATQGLRALDVKWDEGPNARLSSADIRSRFAESSQKPGAPARNDGDAAQALKSAAKKLEAVYETPYLAHATMEPMNCTAHVRSDSCEIWAPVQNQTKAQQAAAEITRLPMKAIQVHTTFLGGGFGRRGEVDFVAEAVEISKSTGVPVKVIWTREDDMQHDFYRPFSYHRFSAALDARGMPVAWTHRMVSQSIFTRRAPDQVKDGVDPMSVEGASTLPYSIPNLHVDTIIQDPGIPVGTWRSVGSSINGFVTESFFDEVAIAGGHDPFELRRQLLDKAPRHKRALELVAAKAGWGQPLPAGRFRGISVHLSYGSYAAEVAEISVSREGKVVVHKVTCAIDCGPIVNPDTIRAQIESAIVYGLTATMLGEITVKNGRIEQANFNNYPMLRMGEVPEVEVHIVPSTDSLGGVGEPGVPPLASAVVNAIFAATGKRIRRLPIRAEDLKSA
jgi:isoquinoline 1-oxidoreductase beta subunit